MVENRIDELRRRLERDPGSRLFAQLAEEHRKAGEHAEAIRVARAGLAFHPSYASARLTLGRALLEAGDAASAAVELAQVVREAPDNILAGRFLGQALEASGDTAGALQQYAATLKMAPGDRQLEGQIAALRASGAAMAAGPVARAATSVPPPPPTKPMELAAAAGVAPPLPPLLSRPVPSPAGAPPVPATIRLVSPPAVGAVPVPAPPAVPPAAPAVDAEDFGERTLMYVPEPTLNVRVEETLRQAPAAPSPAPGAGGSGETPIEDTTLPRAPVGVLPAMGEATSIGETTLPRGPVPDLSPRGALAEPTFADEEPFDETLEPGTVAAVGVEEGVAAGPADVATPRAVAPSPPEPAPGRGPAAAGVGPVAAEAGWSTDTRSYPAVRGVPPDASATVDAPLHSSTLAELYLRQGLTDRAREVYRQVLAEDPANERARSGLRELEAAAAAAPPADPRASRRATLERTITALETLLGALRRD